MVWQGYQNLILVAHAIFAKKEDAGAQQPRNADEAQLQIDRLLGKI